MYIIGGVLLIVVLVIVIRFMVKAAKASPAIYERYQGVFGKGTTFGLLFLGILLMLQGVIFLVIGLIGIFVIESVSKALGAMLLGVVILLFSASISFSIIRGAKSKCPEELKEGLYMAIFIATVGVLGGYCRYCWNVVCVILSMIPGFGWMANFIITKDTAVKKDLVKAGEQWDQEYAGQLDREKEDRNIEDERQREEREEVEDDLRKEVWKEQWRTDIVFNSDSSRWRYSDEDVWRKTEKNRDV